MQLTKQSNHAIRALVYCALNAPKQSRVAEIARAYDISELSLFKFIKPLVDNNILETIRGRHGGIRLARPASEITMREVVQLTDENFALAKCFSDDDSDCPMIGYCGTNAALNQALKAFFAELEKHTIEDLTKRETKLRELLNEDAKLASLEQT